MKAIKCKDTQIEVMLRHEIWNRGLRYRKNVKTVFGTPDIVFTSKKLAVFCDSEFWHGYDWENRKKFIKSNTSFWYAKIERNMARDAEVNENLKSNGWVVLRFWGDEIKNDVSHCADIVEEAYYKYKQ